MTWGKMENFRFQFKQLSTKEVIDMGLTKLDPDNETEEEKIGTDIALQTGIVLSNIHLAQENQGIEDEEFAKNVDYFQKCIETYLEEMEREEIDYDLKTSTLIKYASALGGVLKIYVEFDDGSQAELL